MTLHISAQAVRRFCLDELRPYARENPEFYDVAGREHYRLLAYLSTKVRGNIFDVGTHRGASALALSFNPENTVLSFDVVEKTHPVVDQRRNIHRFVRDLWDPTVRFIYRTALLGSPLILLDVDPHEGEREREFLDWLDDNEYKGIVLLDGVWHFKGLREKVWYQIPRAGKVDLTRVGHWSGTGLVPFGTSVEFDEEPTDEDLAGWTLVTGYFDLTKEPDANPELSSRPPSWYIEEHSSSTLALEHDLVVYTEPGFEETVWRKRPEHLHPRTTVRTLRFSEFPLYRHREEIWKNRGGHACRRDPRNTASFYIMCMSKLSMVEQATKVRPQNTHLAWLDIGIERLGLGNIASLDGALAVRRDAFSTCRIAYHPPPTTDAKAFFGNGCSDPEANCGRCTFCGTFFTVGREAVVEVNALAESEFVRLLEHGYGHVDEQVMAFMHGARPDLFDWYVGDYAQAITNYVVVRENPGAPIANLILPSVGAHDWDAARKSSRILWRSYEAGECRLTDLELDQLLWCLREVRKHT